MNEKAACVADFPINGLELSDGSQVLAKVVQQGGRPAGNGATLERLAKPTRQQFSEFRCCLELRNRIQSLNADVNALERLQVVRWRNPSYLGSKYKS
jgi:hypothetical protein